MTVPNNPEAAQWKRDYLEGPDWWRRKSGWDRMEGMLQEWFEQLLQCEKELERLRNRQTNGMYRKHLAAVMRVWSQQRLGYRNIKLHVDKAVRQSAKAKVGMMQFAAAMKRGAKVLSAEEWERVKATAIRNIEQQQAAERRYRQKHNPPKGRPIRPPCQWEGCGKQSWGVKGYCGGHIRAARTIGKLAKKVV